MFSTTDIPDLIFWLKVCHCKSCEQGKKWYEKEDKPRIGRLVEVGEE
jgi:hypothetical protein